MLFDEPRNGVEKSVAGGRGSPVAMKKMWCASSLKVTALLMEASAEKRGSPSSQKRKPP